MTKPPVTKAMIMEAFARWKEAYARWQEAEAKVKRIKAALAANEAKVRALRRRLLRKPPAGHA